jgi:hypothetical protein
MTITTKKTYQTPVLKKVGTLKSITLKMGSKADASTMTNDFTT